MRRVEVIHAGAAEGAVGGRKPGRLDDVRFNTQAAAQPQNGPGILGDVGLVKSKAHERANLIIPRR